jgi:5-methyltetrahydrofolate--homocysteine methyltransferase
MGGLLESGLNSSNMPHILDALADRVLLCDGGMGSALLALEPDRERGVREFIPDLLCETRPDLVRQIHIDHLRAGADAVETNSFGASPIALAEAGLADRAFGLNRRAAELAREAADSVGRDGRARFVLGAVGPGARLPSRGEIARDTLEDAAAAQCRGLIAGGVDAILIETCQDPLQIRAAVTGATSARAAARADLPIFVQVTVDAAGLMLAGGDIAAAAAVVRMLDVPLLGINCSGGPADLDGPVRWLARNWPGFVSVQPNAGLPSLDRGRAHYPVGPAALARWQERFVTAYGVNLVGGCCGSTAAHVAALDAMLRRLAADGIRPRRSDPHDRLAPGRA